VTKCSRERGRARQRRGRAWGERTDQVCVYALVEARVVRGVERANASVGGGLGDGAPRGKSPVDELV
jgi:hypothetical protein